MDLKDAEKIEFDAMRQRYNRLLIYAGERQCDLYGLQQERIPSVEEMKKMPKEELKIKQQKFREITGTATTTNQLKTCLNCGEKIGALEKCQVFEDNIVCATCYLKLQKQKEQAKQTPSSDAVPERIDGYEG